MDLTAAGFGDTVLSVLPDLQQQAQSLMTLTLRAYAPGLVVDGEGIKVPGFTPQGDTFGKLQGSSASARDAAIRKQIFGGVSRPVFEAGLHLPVDAYVSGGGLQIKAGDQGVGWEFEITGVGSRDDASLVGRRFLVIGVPAKSFATARRLDVAEVS